MIGKELDVLRKVLDYLERAEDLLREAQVEACKLSKKYQWVHSETWALWQYIFYTRKRAQELYSLLLEEEVIE